jgi:hypothetical protein
MESLMKVHPTPRLLVLGALLTLGCEEPAPAKQPATDNTAAAPSAAALPTPAPTAEASEEPPPEKPPQSVAAQHVLVTYRGAKNAPKDVKRTKAAAKKLAEEILAKARSGSDFTGLVKEYSEDPGTKDRLGSVG